MRRFVGRGKLIDRNAKLIGGGGGGIIELGGWILGSIGFVEQLACCWLLWAHSLLSTSPFTRMLSNAGRVKLITNSLGWLIIVQKRGDRGR